MKNFQKGEGKGHGWGVKICDFARESQKKTQKNFSVFFCKSNSILRPFLVRFPFERPVLSSAKRAQNKHKKNWWAQAKLLDALSNDIMQRWSPWGRPWPQRRPRGHILNSLASKIKSLASKPHILENCPVFGSRTAAFWIVKILYIAKKKFLENVFFWRLSEKKILKTFFLENTCACVLGPWPREGLSSEGLSLALASDFFVFLALASSLNCVLDIMEKAKK